MALEISNRDFLRSTVVEPAWYRCRIEEADGVGSLSKNGGSTNFPMEAVILYNADNGDTKFAEVPLQWMFNSKAAGFAIGFLEALGEKPAPGRVDLAAAKGREIDIFVENDTWEGRMINRVNHKYRAPKS